MRNAVITAVCLVALVSCGHPVSRRLEYRTLDSQRLGKPMEFALLRPPSIAGEDPSTWPIIYFLHGFNDDHRSLDRFGLSDRFLTLMEQGALPKAHFVMPYGEKGFYMNWYDGTHPYEDYILGEVFPAAESALGVSPTPSKRHLVGISMGGFGALSLGLRHPRAFASISAISAFVPNRAQARRFVNDNFLGRLLGMERMFGNGNDDQFWNSNNPYPLASTLDKRSAPRILLSAGSQEKEDIVTTTHQFHEHLTNLGIEHTYVKFEGDHNWHDWQPVLERALAFALAPAQ